MDALYCIYVFQQYKKMLKQVQHDSSFNTISSLSHLKDNIELDL